MRWCIGLLLLLSGHTLLAGSPDATWTSLGWNGRGCSGSPNAVVELPDGSIIVGGYFNACGSVDARSLARYDPATNEFSALAATADFTGPVTALLLSNDILYVGGTGMEVPGVAGQWSFARLNLTSGQWDVPPNSPQGLDVSIRDMAEVSGQVYAALQFGNPGLQRFDPITSTWIDIGVFQDNINALHADGDKLIVGGSFQTIGGIAANNIAILSPDEGNSWSALGSGADQGVLAIESDAEHIYVSGWFDTVGPLATDHVARFSRATQSWSPMGQGVVTALQGVRRLRIAGGELYASGEFTAIDGVQANNIARFDEMLNRWQPLGSGVGNASTFIFGLYSVGSDLYVAGGFRTAGGQAQQGVARFQTPTRSWASVGEGTTTAANGGVYEIASGNDRAILMGDFTEIGGVQAAGIAQMNCRTHQISPLGGIVDHQLSSFVTASAMTPNFLYIGGGFFSVGGAPANYLARYRWDTGQWEALPGGSPNNFVRDLQVVGDQLYVAGSFSFVGGLAARRVARYDLSLDTWQTLGDGPQNGTGGLTYALTVSDTAVHVGGIFQEAGGLAASGVAHFDLATNSWSVPSSGVIGSVSTMAVIGRALYVGGIIQSAGGVPASEIARLDLDSGQWSTPGGSVNGIRSVNTLLYRNEQLLVAGRFFGMVGVQLNSIGLLDPDSQQWTELGGGVGFGYNVPSPSSVSAISACGDQIIVGGDFNTAGGETSYKIALLGLPGPLFSDGFDQ